MGYISGVNLRGTATFPSLSFIVTAAPAFSNWRPRGKHFGSRPLREEAEQLLAEARNTIHDLETKLGHKRLAKDEVTQRADAERQKVEEALTVVPEELAAERALRARAERERDQAAVARQTVEQRLRQRTAVKAALPPSAPLPTDHQPPRRRGRPPKIARQDVGPNHSEIVEWWSPGWQEKYR